MFKLKIFERAGGALSKVCCGFFELGVELKSGLKGFSWREREGREKSE